MHWFMLLAANNRPNWFSAIIPLAAGAFYLINYILGERKRARQREQRRGAMNSPANPNAPKPRGSNKPVAADEIEEFLRRAAQQRQAQGAQKDLTSKPASRDLKSGQKNPPLREQRGGSLVSPRRVPERPIVRVPAETIEDSPPRQSLAEHVAKRLASTDFSARAARLSEDMARGDAERAQYIKKFDHQVGTLPQERPPIAPTAEVGAALAPSALQTLMSGLLQPSGLKAAVILNEIFTRPEDRWQ